METKLRFYTERGEGAQTPIKPCPPPPEPDPALAELHLRQAVEAILAERLVTQIGRDSGDEQIPTAQAAYNYWATRTSFAAFETGEDGHLYLKHGEYMDGSFFRLDYETGHLEVGI